MENAQNYCIGGITINLGSDLPIMQDTFGEKFCHFQMDKPGEDTVYLYHHIGIPFNVDEFGEEIYNKIPLIIFKRNNDYVYVMTRSKSLENAYMEEMIGSFIRLLSYSHIINKTVEMLTGNGSSRRVDSWAASY